MKKQPSEKPTVRSIALGQNELSKKIDATRSELINKIDATRSELNNRMGFLTSEMGQMNSRMATKDDLKGFATKDDIGRLALAIQQNQADMQTIQSNMTTKQDFKKIMDTIDAFADDTKAALQNDQIHLAYLKDHEKRISLLESKQVQ